MNKIISTPILLIGFNRPEVIKQSLEYIRKAKPQKLYVTIDGPRADKLGEKEQVDAVRKVVKDIDWECETYYRFSEKNQGAEVTVSEGVSWVLENEEAVIVIEDDIIAPMSFFNFAQEMLIKYADNENVYMISSNQTTPIELPNDEDYLFGIYGHIWGWATWRRAWGKFDLYIDDFDDFLNTSKLDKICQSRKEKIHWNKTINKLKANGAGNNTWDIIWSYIRTKENGLSIIPKVHLSSNIGVEGLHSKKETEAHHRAFDECFIATKHPNEVIRNIEYDNHHFKNHIYKNRQRSIIIRAIRKIKRKLKLN